jgi:hypothetical protein
MSISLRAIQEFSNKEISVELVKQRITDGKCDALPRSSMPQALADKAGQTNPGDSIGLTSREAEERFRRFGANDPASARVTAARYGIELHKGGVGYYAREQSIHVDVGRVRRW